MQIDASSWSEVGLHWIPGVCWKEQNCIKLREMTSKDGLDMPKGLHTSFVAGLPECTRAQEAVQSPRAEGINGRT